MSWYRFPVFGEDWVDFSSGKHDSGTQDWVDIMIYHVNHVSLIAFIWEMLGWGGHTSTSGKTQVPISPKGCMSAICLLPRHMTPAAGGFGSLQTKG